MALGAIIGAGASLIGSIFGGKKKKETVTSHVDYVRMAREAEKAGFNPLTALRNGGAAGFSVTTSSGGGAPLSSRIADGVAGAMGHLSQSDAFLAKFDPHRDAAREAGARLIAAQAANLEASTAAMLSQAANYERRPSGGAAQLSKQGAALGAITPFGSETPAEEERDKVVNPFPVGSDVQIPGDLKSADAWEGFFSDPGGWIGAAYNAYRVYDHNVNKRWGPTAGWLSRNRQNTGHGATRYGRPYDPSRSVFQ